MILIGGLLLSEMAKGEVADETREKARYYFTQGSIEASAERMPQAFEYFKRAYELDLSYGDAAFTYGGQRLFVRNDTLQRENELMRSLEMMRGYVDSNPLDLYATQMYGYMSTALDTVEEAIRVYEATYELMPRETQLLKLLSEAYMRTMKGKEALGSLERYEAIEGKSNEVSLKKITLMLAMQDTVGAVEEVESLIRLNPRDPYSRILKGNLYEVTGNPDSVIKAYKEAERLAPDNGSVKMSLANYYRERGDSVMLDNMIYEALLSEDLELEDKLGILADYLQKLLDEQGDKSRGDHLFEVLKQQYAHEPQVMEMAARYAGAKGAYNEAVEAINYAIDMDPGNEIYWLMLLSFELTDGRTEDAVKDYERAKEHLEPTLRLKRLYSAAVSLLSDTEEAEGLIRTLLAEAGAPEERSDSFRRSLDYDSLEYVSSLYCILGDLYYKRGEPDKGFDEYETSLYFLPDNVLALNNYAYFLSEEDRELEKAKKMSRRALELSEDNPTYLDTYAWILYKMGEYREAKEYIDLATEKAFEMEEENEEYEKHKAAIYEAVNGME